jgi:hypothetical protein
MLLHVSRAVLLAEFLDYGFGTLDSVIGFAVSLASAPSRINPNLLVLEHVAIPLGVRTPNGQQIKSVAFSDEPDRIRDCRAGLSADDCQLDLAVAGEAVF